jgi:hypothetical protein
MLKNEIIYIDTDQRTLIIETHKMFHSETFAKELIKEIKNMLYLYQKIDFELFISIYTKLKNYFIEIIHPIDPKSFFNILDEDKDGFLNEDELILILSILKSKMCHLDKELICEGLYKVSTQLKSFIFNLSKMIFSFQEFLRERLYKTQLNKFEQIIGNKTISQIKKRKIFTKMEN